MTVAYNFAQKKMEEKIMQISSSFPMKYTDLKKAEHETDV